MIGGLSETDNQNSMSQHGRDLPVKLERKAEIEDGSLFVARILGYIIVKYAICRSAACQSQTITIIFLGTPRHRNIPRPPYHAPHLHDVFREYGVSMRGRQLQLLGAVSRNDATRSCLVVRVRQPVRVGRAADALPEQ